MMPHVFSIPMSRGRCDAPEGAGPYVQHRPRSGQGTYIYITASLARKAANTYDTLCWWIVNYADHLFRAELSLKNKLTILPIQVTLCLLNWILNGTQNCCVCQEKTHRL